MRPPIIVGGNPRSGTTFVAAMLNEHPDIIITSELEPKAAALMVEMMARLTTYMGRKAHRNRYWTRKRPELQLEIWRATTSDKLYRDKPDARLGHKTPGVELLFDDYVHIFEPAARPKLIYCMRDGTAVLRSLLNMPWAPVPFEDRLAQYLESVATFERLRERYPDDVHLLQVDRMPTDPDARVARLGELFAFLDEPMTEPVVAYVRDWQPRNTRADVTGDDAATELTDEQLARLAAHEDFAAIQRRYGYAAPDPDPPDGQPPADAGALDLARRGWRRARRVGRRLRREARAR